MEFLSEFGLAVVSAAILQNVVLTRGLGSCRRTLTLPVPRQILYLGGTLTVVTVLAALIAWPLNRLVRTYQSQMQLTLRYITSITALVSICLVFLLLYLGTRAFFPRLHYHLRELMVPASLNCAVLGSIIIALTSGYGVLQVAGYALGSGIGYTLACCSSGKAGGGSPWPTSPGPSGGCRSYCSIWASFPWRSMV